MYFISRPKTERRDLFGAEFALASLRKALLEPTTRMVVIKGLRRTGKTSLLNVALTELPFPAVKIDVREGPYHDRAEFFSFLVEKIRKSLGEPFIQKIIQKVSGVGLGYQDFSATLHFVKERNIMLFIEDLHKQLSKPLVLAFDEVQLLKNAEFDYLLASIFDNYPKLKLVLTGSEVGLLDAFLGKQDYDAPLYGRAYLEIELRRLASEEAARYLIKGFSQIHKNISFEEIREVLGQLDGIIGWLTLYGWQRSQGIPHQEAIERVLQEGKETTRRELQRFLEKRKAPAKYGKVLRAISKGGRQWSSLKQNLSKRGLKISDTQLNLYLHELLAYSFIEKTAAGYRIADPLLEAVVR